MATVVLTGIFPNGAKIVISHLDNYFAWVVSPPYPSHSRLRHDWSISESTAKRKALENSHEATEGKPGRWKWTRENV